MTWYSEYVALWDVLCNLVKDLVDADGNHIFESKNVFYGEKYPPDEYPSCFVCPLPITITPLTFLQSTNSYYFEFGVVTTNSDTKQGYLTSFELIGKIYDALVTDRSQGGKVCGTEPEQILPNWRNLGSGVEGFWTGLRVKFTRIRA